MMRAITMMTVAALSLTAATAAHADSQFHWTIKENPIGYVGNGSTGPGLSSAMGEFTGELYSTVAIPAEFEDIMGRGFIYSWRAVAASATLTLTDGKTYTVDAYDTGFARPSGYAIGWQTVFSDKCIPVNRPDPEPICPGEASLFTGLTMQVSSQTRYTYSIDNPAPEYMGDFFGIDSNNNAGRPRFRMFQAAIPEPASWLTMVIGFACIGALVRRRRAWRDTGAMA